MPPKTHEMTVRVGDISGLRLAVPEKKHEPSLCERCRRIAALIKKWDNKDGHERCWYYPDIFREIAAELGMELQDRPRLPPEAEFKEFCDRYRKEEYDRVVERQTR